MEKLFERLNLYDIVAMIVPGSVVLMGLGMFNPICDYAQRWPFVEYYGMEGHAFWTVTAIILFIAVSYMIGIIIQTLNVYVWMWAKHLNYVFIDKYNEKKINDNKGELKVLMADVEANKENAKKKKDSALCAYYKAYNYAIVFHPQTAVLTLEKQIAMLRNMIFAIFPLCIAIFPFAWYWAFVCWFGIAMILFGIICARMKKAVVLVFEEYEAVKQLELDTK